MKCLYCKEEVWSLGTKPKKYCSDAHRKAHKRQLQTDKRTPDLQTDTSKRTDRVLLRNKDKVLPASVVVPLETVGQWTNVKTGTVLHPAIIRTINRLTTNPDGTVDEQARTTRLANAKHYEQVCPGRPYTGVTDKALHVIPKHSGLIPDGNTTIEALTSL